MTENPTKIDNDIQTEVPGEQKLRELKDNIDNEESTVNNENKIDSSTEDTFAPVIKVTKHEAVFTKGDLKLQKVTVTEDISIRHSSHEDLLVQEVPSLQPLRIPRNEELEENGTNGVEEDKAMTRAQRAPKQRLRQALESLKKRRDSAENNAAVPTKRRSSIPKLIRKNKNNEESTPKEETKPEIPIEAEFEKIYDEIVDNEPIDLIDESKLEEIIADVKDPEEKFEEVVHAYEENKLQPISIEKPKSRIPLKKQISQNEAKVENPKPSLRKSYSVDSRNTVKQSAAKKSKDVAVKQNVKSKDEYVNIHEKEDIVTYRVVQTVDIDDDLKRNGDIIHPSFSNDPNNNDYKIIKQDNDVLHSSERNVNTPDEVDRNKPIIGKVGRLISKIDSNEFAYNDKKRKDDVSGSFKKVSILSKIAMFEEVSAKSEVTPRTPPPTPITIDKPKLSNQISFERRRPIIVEEVYKEETAANFEENPTNDNLVLHSKKDTGTDKEIIEIREANNYDVQANLNEEYNNNDNENDITVVIDEVSKETEPEDVDSRLHRLISRQDERLRKAVSITDLAVNHEDVNEVNSIDRHKDEKEYLHEASSIERHMREREENESSRPRPRRMSVSDKIALFENKLTPVSIDYLKNTPTRKLIDYKPKITPQLSRSNLHKSTSSLTKSISSLTIVESKTTMTEEQYAEKIEDLKAAKMKYGVFKEMKYVELNNGEVMPVIALGTALLDPKLTYHIVTAAIDLGYRSFDTAYIYGNEKAVGDAIRARIEDGTIKREELFIINKLWSTFHRTDLVEVACRNSLDAMGLDYFDLYLVHNPMSFKEGSAPLPKIANVIQFSAHDFLDAWFGMEGLVSKGLVKSIGVSNFNSAQVARVVEKGRIRPVVNQAESHPYLNQLRLADACLVHDVVLSCYGCLGSVGSEEYRSPAPPVIEDSVVKVAAAGLGVTPAQLLLRYQLELGRTVVTKASSADRLWNNLLALTVDVDPSELAALNALNRNKRMFTFKGMGDTHRNYPFNIPF